MDDVLARLNRLERRQSAYHVLFVVLLIALIAACVSQATAGSASTHPQPSTGDGILRVRGLIVEDASGRPRILVGAPTPSLPGRGEDRRSVSVTFLGEDGAERLIVGYAPDPVVAGQVKQRIMPAVGMILHSADGTERGGMGFLDDGENGGRAAVVLDRPKGDALGMMVDDKSGFAGFVLNYAPDLGQNLAASLSTEGSEVALKLNDVKGKPSVALTLEPNGKARLVSLDADGHPAEDLVPRAPQK